MNELLNRRIIRIAGGSIFLSPVDSLPMASTTLDPEKMRFRPGREFFWETEIIGYEQDTSTVRLRVIDYSPSVITGFENQKLKHPVRFIGFDPLDWKQLEPQLSFYQFNHMLYLLEEGQGLPNITKAVNMSEEISGVAPVGSLSVSGPYQPAVAAETTALPTIRVIEERFMHYFTEAEFSTGCVKLVKSFKWHAEPLIISIENSDLIPEFDLIKSFFHKAFSGQKKFEVLARFELSGDTISGSTAYSPQIAMINETLIEGVKRAQALSFIRTLPPKVDKSLFTADEFMGHYADNEKEGNVLKQTELDILKASLSNLALRNRKQIEFLAGSQQSPQHKIRFTLKPVFGFVFMIEGQTMNHFCWELLNSHATYLWSFNKAGSSPEKQYRRVELIIASIRESGREYYKNNYHYIAHEPDMIFSVINHRQANSAIVDGFPDWKHRLLERLV